MDGRAERDHEACDVLRNSVDAGLLERYRDSCGRGLCSKSCEVCREHVPEQLERVLLCKASGDHELDDQDADVDQEDDADDLYEDGQDREYLADIGHVEEDAEDVEREEGNDR